MIRSLFLLMVLSFFATIGQACDGCGSAITGGGIGLMTQANARYLGLSYRFSQFHLGDHLSSSLTKDRFSDLQVVARFSVTKRLLVQGSLPYRMISREGEESLAVNKKGIGDANLSAYWTIADKLSEKGQRLFWSIGTGVVLPTGAYDGTFDDRTPDHLHPGGNAWGLMLQSNLSLQFAKWGINAQASGALRQPNSASYRFGNQWTQSVLVFWRQDFGKLSLAPFAGLYSEMLQNGRRNDVWEYPSTAGQGLFTQAGIEAGRGAFNFTAQVQLPMQQNYSDGEAKAQPRFTTSVAYLF